MPRTENVSNPWWSHPKGINKVSLSLNPKVFALTPHLFRWWCHRSPCWGSSPLLEGCHPWPSLKRESKRLLDWNIYLIMNKIQLWKCFNCSGIHTQDIFFKKAFAFFFVCSQAFVALVIPTVPVVSVMQLCTQPQRPIFNFTPSTHSTGFWSHQGNDKIQSGRSSGTFHALLPPPTPTPIHHVHHCWRLPGSLSGRRDQGLKISKGSFPKWGVNN